MSVGIMGFDSLRQANAAFDWSQRWSLFDGGADSFNLAAECVDRHLRRRPRDVAARLIGPQLNHTTLTFEELAEASSAVAALLLERGVSRGDSVILHLEPGREWLASMFGILRIGAVFVPVNPLLGQDALSIRLRDAAPRAAISDSPSPQFGTCPILGSRDVRRAVDRGSSLVPAARTRGADAAIYTYSSGSTGRPKRTALQHQAFTFLAVIIGKFVLDLKPEDRYLACYASGWLGGFGWGVLLPLCLGTAAGLYSGRFDAELFLNEARASDADVLHCPPTVYRRLIAREPRPRLGVRALAYTAEGLDAGLAEAIRDTFGCYARGHYGATELGMVALDYAYPDYQVRPGALGKPLIGTKVLVVDDNDQPLPPGRVGRLCVEKAGQVRFTGDLGWRDDDGYLWHRGRGDDVIISAGYTIGAAEIESALRRHSSVAEVAVISVPDPERGHVPKAFVQLRHDAPPAPAEAMIREFQNLSRELVGAHAYPREIAFVTEFPRNEGGKIAKAELARPGSDTPPGNATSGG